MKIHGPALMLQCLKVRLRYRNEWGSRPRFCTVKAILGRGQPELVRWFLAWIIPLVQDHSRDMFINSLSRIYMPNDFFTCLYYQNCVQWYSPVVTMNGVLSHDSAQLRLYWSGDNLGEWDKICYESCPWRRIYRWTCWPVVQLATTIPRMSKGIKSGCIFISYTIKQIRMSVY